MDAIKQRPSSNTRPFMLALTSRCSYSEQIGARRRPCWFLGRRCLPLLISCANVAICCLAINSRKKAFVSRGTRAGRLRIIRQLLTEICAVHNRRDRRNVAAAWGVKVLFNNRAATFPRRGEIMIGRLGTRFNTAHLSVTAHLGLAQIQSTK